VDWACTNPSPKDKNNINTMYHEKHINI